MNFTCGTEWERLKEQIAALTVELKASEAANAQMREALELIQNYNLCDKCGTVPIEGCPKCNETATFRTAHNALKLPNGQPLLDKLARYREALEVISKSVGWVCGEYLHAPFEGMDEKAIAKEALKAPSEDGP